MKKIARSPWLVPVLLLIFGSTNILIGVFRLGALQQGPPPAPDEYMHYFATPLPIVLHIISGSIFNLLAPLQFAPKILQRWPSWHRWSGRLLVVDGFLIGLTGIWMNENYPVFGGLLKYSGVAVYSIGIIVALSIALSAIRNGDIKTHRAWMLRAIAITLSPATQFLFFMPIFVSTGTVTDRAVGVIVWAALLVNLAVAQWASGRSNRDDFVPNALVAS